MPPHNLAEAAINFANELEENLAEEGDKSSTKNRLRIES
jgi:hypothetical protein